MYKNHKKKRLNFSLLVGLTFLFTYLFNELLNTNDLLINSLGEQFTVEQIESVLDLQEKWSWVGFAILPVLLFIKVILIAAVIDLGLFFYDEKLKYKEIVHLVIKAEYVFLLVIVFKAVWFLLFETDYTLEELQYFYPFSMLTIVGYEGLAAWFVYPFQVINLFELAYWFVLAYFLGKELKTTTEKGFSIVASSYGVALLIWVVGMMFITLNIS